jgi:hypothetical protein
MSDLKNSEVILELKDLSVDRVEIQYSGSGDSGDIDDVTYYDKAGEGVEIEEKYEEVHEKVKDYALIILNDIEDWWNNDGGYGILNLFITENTYSIENHIYITDTEDYFHEGDLIKE